MKRRRRIMKAVKKKVVTGLKLITAGGLLTGGSMLMERLTETPSPKISGHDVTYNSDTGYHKVQVLIQRPK